MNKVTPPPVFPLVDNGASMEAVMTRTMDGMGKQNEQISIWMKEQERAVHIERECQREEINAGCRAGNW